MAPGTVPKSFGDRLFFVVTACAAALVLALLVVLVLRLTQYAWPAISRFGLRFLVDGRWDIGAEQFGAASSIYGTLITTLIAMLIAAPLGVASAMFLVEMAPSWLSGSVGVALELLAAVPSIIYGMWGLFIFAPFMANYVQPTLAGWLGFLPLFQGPKMGLGVLTAGIILALMILPFITAVSRDVFRLVPPVMKESAYGVGATTWEVTRDVSLRYGVAGIAGALFLGLGRALGETMAVTFVIGNNHALSASLFDAGNTIASTLANEFAEADSDLHRAALVELGLVLFGMTLVFQLLAQLWLRRVRKSMGSRR